MAPGFDFFLSEAELSETMGRKVDLRMASFQSEEFRQAALAEAFSAYEQA
jgi:predicted nucleotidyltransferase